MSIDLSVVIPCYNYAHYMKETLDSIVSQDYPSFEIVLVDDGSTDSTPKVGEAYAEKYPHVRYFRLEKNSGFFHANTIGLKIARGEFIHFFSADDLYFPGFLSKSMDLLHAHPALNLVCSDMGYFREDVNHLEKKRLIHDHMTPSVFAAAELPRLCRERSFRVPGASCVMRRDLIERYGSHDPKLENISDWYLLHKMAFSEGIGYIPEVLVAMRSHPDAYTSQVKRNKKRRRATYHHLLDYLSKDRRLRHQFIEAGLLDFIFHELKWKLYLNPKYRAFWFK